MKKQTMLVATFKTAKELLAAAKRLKNSGYNNFETYSPYPIHGMDSAMKLKPSKLAWLSLIGGLTGLIFGFGLQIWVSTEAYPLVISGKPLASYPAYIPVAFEITILFAGFATVFGMFHMNRLPTYNRLVFEYSKIKEATSHSFCISIEMEEKESNVINTKEILMQLGGESIELIKEKE